MLFGKMREGKLTYTQFKNIMGSHADKVSPEYFEMVMKTRHFKNGEKMQYLNAAMMNNVVTDTTHALEISFTP